MTRSAKAGVIRWISGAHSFGLITPDDQGDDLFASFHGVVAVDLKVGQKVSYDVEPGHHGGRAVNVQIAD